MTAIQLFVSTEEFDPVSAIIRLRTDCAWSHTGFLRVADGYTFSAMMSGGVAWRPPNPKAKIMALNYASAEAALGHALTQEGDPYDMLDILGIATGRNWSEPGETICDKIVFWACQQVPDPLLNHDFIPLIHLNPSNVLTSLKVSQAAPPG